MVVGCPQTHFPSAVSHSPLPVAWPAPAGRVLLFRQRNREMASRPLPPAPARMCGTAGSVAGLAAAGLCLRAGMGSAGSCGLPTAGFALSPPPRDRAHPQPSPAPSPRARRGSTAGQAGSHGTARHCGLPLQAPVPAHRSHGAPAQIGRCPHGTGLVPPRPAGMRIPGSRHGGSAPPRGCRRDRGSAPGAPARPPPREMRASRPAGSDSQTPAWRECGPRQSRGSRGQDGLVASRLRLRMFAEAGPGGSADPGGSTGILHKGPGAVAGSCGRGVGSRPGAWAKGLRSRGGQEEGWPGQGRGRKQRRRGAESILPGGFAGGPLSPRKRLAWLETAGMERLEQARRVGLSPAPCPQARLHRPGVPGAEVVHLPG